MNNKVLAPLLVVLAAILGVAASFALPVPAKNSWLGFHAYLGVTLGMAVTYAGASVIFLRNLRGFTQRLRRAYIILCIGFSLFGLASVQLPLVVYSGAVESFFRGTGLVAVPFVVSLLAILFGMRAFARLFGVRSIATNYWFAFLPPIAIAALYSLLPHAATSTTEANFDAANAFSVFNAWINLVVLVQVLQIKRRAGVLYSNALAWLVVCFSLLEVGVIGYLSAVLPFGDEQWFLVGAVPLVPLLIAAFCLLRSSYAFSRITDSHQAEVLAVFTARSFFGKPLKPRTDANVNSVDIAIYASNMVSNVQDVDVIMDRVRQITADRQPGQALSPEEDAQLMQVYLSLERYLLEQEAVRVFTKDSLRQTIADGLRLTSAEGTFWGRLPA